ncbi:MAG: alpha/beta hydrolase [Deltaproteobacteria bacterium]|nr:alpha/beta hydrolase [Deltaproteobacteria bacterium]
MATETWTHGFATTNGIRLHYVEQGQGPLLLLLHGFPVFWYSWRHQIPVLAQHFHVVAPDLRGFNDSDKPEGVDQYQLHHLVEDVGGLLRFFGQEKVIVVGHDAGAFAAWAFAATYPEATERLIACANGHPGVLQKFASQGYAEHAAALRRMFYIFFHLVPEVPERFYRKYNYAFFDDWRRNHPERFTAEDIAEYKKALAKPGALTAGLNYYRALLPPEVLVGEVPLLSEKVRCPTLLIVGENSHIASPAATEWSREFVEAPFTLRVVPKAGHWVQLEQPELVNQHLLEFLADV